MKGAMSGCGGRNTPADTGASRPSAIAASLAGARARARPRGERGAAAAAAVTCIARPIEEGTLPSTCEADAPASSPRGDEGRCRIRPAVPRNRPPARESAAR